MSTNNNNMKHKTAIEADIPVDKLKDNLRILKESNDEKQLKPCALLCTGSYNPVHKMHLQMFQEAYNGLQAMGYQPVAGWISPSHNDYVSAKLRKEAIPVNHRIEMCRLLTKDSKWMDVSTWEAAQNGFYDFPDVLAHHAKEIETQFGIEVFYLCGGDHAAKCSLQRGIYSKYHVVCLDREGAAKKYHLKQGPRFHLIEQPPTSSALDSDLSSTKVRRKMEKGLPVNEECGDSVAQYIKENIVVKKE